MFAMCGKLTTKPGTRSEFVQILRQAADIVAQMAGCRMYLVTESLDDEDVIHVLELWESAEAHAASLQNEAVRELIGQAMPLLEGAPAGNRLRVVGGFGVEGVGQN
jgi:quinol monooxygenase YgiN